jgi:hypothetical protein
MLLVLEDCYVIHITNKSELVIRKGSEFHIWYRRLRRSIAASSEYL